MRIANRYNTNYLNAKLVPVNSWRRSPPTKIAIINSVTLPKIETRTKVRETRTTNKIIARIVIKSCPTAYTTHGKAIINKNDKISAVPNETNAPTIRPATSIPTVNKSQGKKNESNNKSKPVTTYTVVTKGELVVKRVTL